MSHGTEEHGLWAVSTWIQAVARALRQLGDGSRALTSPRICLFIAEVWDCVRLVWLPQHG